MMKKSPSNRISPGDALVNNFLSDGFESRAGSEPNHNVATPSGCATATLPNITRNQAVFVKHAKYVHKLLGANDDKVTLRYKENRNQLEITATKRALGSVLMKLNEVIGNIKEKSHYLPDLLCSYFRSDISRISKFNVILQADDINAVGVLPDNSEKFHVLSATSADLQKASQLLCAKYSSVCLEIKDNILWSASNARTTAEFEATYQIKLLLEHENINSANTTDIKMAGYVDDVLLASQNIYELVEKLKGS